MPTAKSTEVIGAIRDIKANTEAAITGSARNMALSDDLLCNLATADAKLAG